MDADDFQSMRKDSGSASSLEFAKSDPGMDEVAEIFIAGKKWMPASGVP
jgi:hypothetical protein